MDLYRNETGRLRKRWMQGTRGTDLYPRPIRMEHFKYGDRIGLLFFDLNFPPKAESVRATEELQRSNYRSIERV